MREQEPRSLSELQDKFSQIQRAMGKVVEVGLAIGTPNFELRPDLNLASLSGIARVEAVVRVGGIREKIIERTIPILESKRAVIEEEIKKRRQEIETVEERLDEIRRLVGKGYLQVSEIEETQRVLASLKGIAFESSLAPAAVQPLTKDESKDKVFPNVRINLETMQVEIDSRIVNFSASILWDVFIHLAKNARQDIPSQQIVEIARRDGSVAKTKPGGNVIANIRDNLETDPNNPKLITRSGTLRKSYYCLNAQIEFVGESREKTPTLKIPEEEMVLPIRVNLEKREVEVNGVVKKIRSEFSWNVFLYLLENIRQDVPSVKLAEIARRFGSKAKIPVGGTIAYLRDILDPDPQNPRLIVTHGATSGSKYMLNAQVEVVGELENPSAQVASPTDVIAEIVPQPVLSVGEVPIAVLERLIAEPEVEQIEDEEGLINDLKARSEKAALKIDELYRARLYRYFLARTSKEEAEDLTQEVFFRMLNGLDRYERREDVPFAVWLFTIARNLVVSKYRRNQRQPDLAILSDDLPVLINGDVEKLVEGNIAYEEILAVVDKLPPMQRQVIEQRLVRGLSLAETAKVLGKTENNIKVVQHGALATLRKILTPPVVIT